MLSKVSENTRIFLLLAAILLSRIPFLFAGYGSEEDAWGLILTARNIAHTGVYEVSRMPGHPVQELLLSACWNWSAPWLNFLTALAGVAGIGAFMAALRRMHIRNYLEAGAMLAFVPVITVNSTNVMDYVWALSITLFSWLAVTHNRYFLAGILLGIACGFRVTAGAMGIPLAILLFSNMKSVKPVLVMGLTTIFTCLICFIPAFEVYGASFFTYYEYFPYPPFLKNVYKATFGAWGIGGMIVLTAGIAACLYHLRKQPQLIKNNSVILLMALSGLLLYSYSFIRIPQKAAFVIPIALFTVVAFAALLPQRPMRWLTVTMLFSSFFAGINLNEPLRGSTPSSASVQTQIGNTPVSIDLLMGPAHADLSKRRNKIAYAEYVASHIQTITSKTVVIAGWWQNEINYFLMNKINPLVKVVYYSDEKEIISLREKGYTIVYLPEQDYYNDLRFSGSFTAQYAVPFSAEPVSPKIAP